MDRFILLFQSIILLCHVYTFSAYDLKSIELFSNLTKVPTNVFVFLAHRHVKHVIRIFAFSISLNGYFLYSQENETSSELGNFFIQNYQAHDYNGNPRIYDITQDQDGIIYFVDGSSSVFSFNGTRFSKITIQGKYLEWRTIHVKNDTLYLGNGTDETGNRYSDFGFITKDVFGKYEPDSFYSIRKHITDSIRFYGMFKIQSTDNAVFYLLQGGYLVRWQNQKVDLWPLNTYRNFSIIDDQAYLPSGKSLLKLSDEKLIPNEVWSQEDLSISSIIKVSNGKFIANNRSAIYTLSDSSVMVFNSELDDVLKEYFLNGSTPLHGDWFVLSTLGGGVLIFDHKIGKLVASISIDEGLADNFVIRLLHSSEGDLWVATHNGLSRIEVSSSYTLFDQKNGLKNSASGISRYNGKLYIGNVDGVFYLNDNQRGNTKLTKVSGNLWVSYLDSFDQELIVGTNKQGIFKLIDGELSKLIEFPAIVQDIHRLSNNRDLLLVRSLSSIYLLEIKNDKWVNHGKISEQSGEFFIEEFRPGSFWLMDYRGLVNIKIDENYNSVQEVKSAFLDQKYKFKLYENFYRTSVVNNEILAYGGSTIARYNPEIDSLEPYKDRPWKESIEPYQIINEPADHFWIIAPPVPSPLTFNNSGPSKTRTSRYLLHATRRNGVLHFDDSYLKAWEEIAIPGIVYSEDNGITWMSGYNSKLLRHDANKKENSINVLPKMTIDGVRILDKDSSVINTKTTKDFQLEFPADNNNIRFLYSLIDYQDPDSSFYRYKLSGLNDTWSSWTHETQKDYTNIRSGTYTFEVQGYDYNTQSVSPILSVDIKIIPPWYLTAWAKIFYGLVMVGFVWLLIKIRNWQLIKEKNRLEKIVEERTKKLSIQAEELKEMDKMKSRFFSNISHEFRTPLTLILGPLKKIYEGEFKGDTKTIYEMMIRNANRLHQLINQLLDLSRLESGKMNLNLESTEVVDFTKMYISNYSSLAKSKAIEFQFVTERKELKTRLDRDKYEKILSNLISNAFKFTPEKGTIEVCLAEAIREGKPYLKLVVSDTGLGIPEDQLDKIFDRFHQIDGSHTRASEGTGIGLSLIKELVEFHGGSIDVNSKLGAGTTFKVFLPIEEGILKTDSIRTSEFNLPTELIETNTGGISGSYEQNLSDILVIEDNDDMRSYIHQSLNKFYNLYEATDGIEGLKKSEELLPDLILSDVMMPNMDGIELCRNLKTNIKTSHIPVVLLTAKSDRSSKITGLETGADDYLSKPFDEGELKLIIDNRIKQRKLLRERWGGSSVPTLKGISVTSIDEKFLENAIALVEKNISNESFGVEDLVKGVGLSRSQLHRKLTSLTNLSASNFIRSIRLKRAHFLIEKKTGSISEIAYGVGFSSPQYFNKAFKQEFGYPPGHLNKGSVGASEITKK